MRRVALNIITIALALVLSLPLPAMAGWLDDWKTATVVTPPSNFKGSERSYYDFGSYNARWKSGTWNPISIQPARLKAGCGGIDTMLGGMSFGNADQLVKKLQEVLQNSPSVALDLAINVLCQECANSMKWIEDKLNALNNIQLDSCKASKALVYSAASALDPDNEAQELQSPMADYMQSSGISNAYTEVTKAWESTGGQTTPTQVADSISECPYAVRAVFATPEGMPQTTLFDNMAAQLSLSPEYAQAIRGIVGDVGIKNSAGMYKAWAIEPCAENKDILTSGAMTKVYLKDTLGACTQSSDVQSNMELWIKTKLDSIAYKMISKTILDNDEKEFSYNYMNGLHRQILSFGLMSTNGKDADKQVNVLTPLIMKHITVQMIGDLTYLTRQMISQAKEVIDLQGSTTNPTNQAKCQISLFSGSLAQMEKFQQKVNDFYTVVRTKESEELQKVANQAQMAAAFQSQETAVRAKVMQQFSSQGAASIIK